MTPEFRKVYRLRSRNLLYGVYDGNGGFTGIRTKFGARYLDTEFINDPPGAGTVSSYENTEISLPEDVGVWEVRNSTPIDALTGRAVKFDRPIDRGGKGWYFLDTGEPSQKIQPMAVPNTRLFDFLDRMETALDFSEEMSRVKEGS